MECLMKEIFLKRGQIDCRIIIPNDPTPVEKTAAEELCNYTEKTLGIKLDIVTENGSNDEKAIFVGHTEYAEKADIFKKTDVPFRVSVLNART